MTIKISLPKIKEGNEVKTGIGTKVFNDKGDEVTNVTSVDIHVSGDSIITATMDIAVGSIDEMDNIHALLGTETLEQIAALHGYELVSI